MKQIKIGSKQTNVNLADWLKLFNFRVFEDVRREAETSLFNVTVKIQHLATIKRFLPTSDGAANYSDTLMNDLHGD